MGMENWDERVNEDQPREESSRGNVWLEMAVLSFPELVPASQQSCCVGRRGNACQRGAIALRHKVTRGGGFQNVR